MVAMPVLIQHPIAQVHGLIATVPAGVGQGLSTGLLRDSCLGP